MSGDDGNLVWISDIDGYIDVDNMHDPYELSELELLEIRRDFDLELDELGEFPLLSGAFISARRLDNYGISPKSWRYQVHLAERSLQDPGNSANIERILLDRLLSLGNRYALARYAKWEKIYFHTALTATFPHGISALLDQFMTEQKLTGIPSQRRLISETLQFASQKDCLTAYERTGIVQAVIHKIVTDACKNSKPVLLDRTGMKNILSLVRLHYSAGEIRVRWFGALNKLNCLYQNARDEVRGRANCKPVIAGRHIRNWELRHLQPLTYFYPYSIRYAIDRGIRHFGEKYPEIDRNIAINEIALAHCSEMRMRRAAKSRDKSN